MGHHIRGAAALVSLGLLGLAGCQNFQNLTGYSSSTTTAASSGAVSNLMPGMSPTANEGNDPGRLSGAPLKNMRGTNAEKLEAFLATAKEMENSGKWADAIQYYEQIRQLDPHRSLFCARHLAFLYDRKGDFDKALEEYHAILKVNPKDAAAHNDLGYGYYHNGKFEAAEKSLRKAVEYDPKNKRAWSNLAMTLAQLGRYDESLAAFEKVVPRAQALYNVGFFQVAQGKWVDARDNFAAALQLEPGLQRAELALKSLAEGKRANKDRDRAEGKKRARDLEPPPAVDPEVASRLPFGAPTGAVGADSGMLFIAPDDAPINLPVPGSYPLPPVAARTPSAAASDPVPQPPLPLPPIPSQLVVD